MSETNNSNNIPSFKVIFRGSKKEDQKEVRRFSTDKEITSSFANLKEKLMALFPRLHRDQFTLSWTDVDGDNITISSDEELNIALTELTGPVYKLNVANNNSNSNNNNNNGNVHCGVLCDGCDGEVRGFRYKCVVCPDYDLCGSCESKGKHREHIVVRIAKPAGHPNIRKNDDDNKPFGFVLMAAPGPLKPHCGPLGRGPFGPHGGRGFRCAMGGGGRPTWIEAMARQCQEQQQGEGTSEKPSEANDDKAPENNSNDNPATSSIEKEGATAGGRPTIGEIPIQDLLAQLFGETSGGADFQRHVGDLVASFLEPLGVKIDVETNSNKGKDEEKPEKAEENSNLEDAKEDGWTLIRESNQEKGEPSKNNVVYPELPKEEQSAEDPKEVLSKVVSHPDLRIQVALQAMINMGFSDDGGWLTNLLEAKNGDVSKTLDALQPKH